MTTITQLASIMQTLLTTVADQLAVETGFVRRRSALTGARFAQALVLGWLANPQATEAQLAQAAAAVGAPISAQGLMARCTRSASDFMQQLLATAVGHLVVGRPAAVALLDRFAGVYIQDSTTITLPDVLVDIWPGSGGHAAHPTVAGLKVQVQWDYHSGQLRHLLLQAGVTQDRAAPLQSSSLPAGALRLADLGYFSVPVLAAHSAAGEYWLTRPQVNTQVWTAADTCVDLVTLLRGHTTRQLELPIRLGKQERLPCRLLAVRVPQEVADRRRQALHTEARRKGQAVSPARLALADWTILVTNVPAPLLNLAEALVLLGCRWQIELLFKLWKSHGYIDVSRSQQPWRVLTEVYAKLLAMLVQHWLFLVGHWSHYDRSLFKAAQTVRQHALHLAVHLAVHERLVEAIEHLVRCLCAGCRINKSRTAPRTFQRLRAVALDAQPTADDMWPFELLMCLDAATS